MLFAPLRTLASALKTLGLAACASGGGALSPGLSARMDKPGAALDRAALPGIEADVVNLEGVPATAFLPHASVYHDALLSRVLRAADEGYDAVGVSTALGYYAVAFGVALFAVLVNPGVAVATPAVFKALPHKDNPEKAQYDEREIKTINGFNIADFSELTRSEITQIKKTLQALIRQYDIVEYAQLMDFLQDEEMNVEYEVASNNTLFFDRYIGSRRHAPRVPKCDPETGEVIEKKES